MIRLAVAQVLLDGPSERRFLRVAARRLGHLFPVLLGQSGYKKRVRRLGRRDRDGLELPGAQLASRPSVI